MTSPMVVCGSVGELLAARSEPTTQRLRSGPSSTLMNALFIQTTEL